MSIGRFARASGLTVKALRFYDETGLLPAADVDPVTGYRRYRAGQLRQAAAITVLRATGLRLADVRRVLDDPDLGPALLAEHADHLVAARARQDAALAHARSTLATDDRTVEVRVRPAPEQAWVGAVLTVDPAAIDPEQDAQEYNEVFARLAQALVDAGEPPVGSFWTTIRGADGDGEQIVLCWPVADDVDPTLTVDGLQLERGCLPERRECFVRILFDDDAPLANPVDGPPHPALIALLEHLEDAGEDAEVIRQVGVPGPGGVPVGLDVAVSLAAR